MPTIRIQASFERDTFLPEDLVVNTFHFFQSDPPSGDLTDLFDRVQNFYIASNAPSPGTGRPAQNASVASFFGAVMGTTCTLKGYNLADATPRVPLNTRIFNFVPSATDLPEEVACCLSYRAALVSGENAARRRGRIYIGTLGQGAAEVISGRVRVNAQLTNNLLAASQQLIGPNQASADARKFIVRSDVGGLVSTPAVAEFYVDNALDTQRRRGPDATQRFVVPATPMA
jgi:hypothetical protein